MIPVGHLFVIEEGIYNDTKEALSKYFSHDSVKDFIGLSKKVVEDGVESLSDKEQKTYRGLFEDDTVKDYIAAARRAGERDGWIRGSVLGGVSGATSGIALAGGSVAGAVVLGLLGAAAAGVAFGWTLSKALSWTRKWRAEDDIVKLGRAGGQFGKTSILARTD